MTEMTECEKEIIALKMRINWLQGERDFYRDERDDARREVCKGEAIIRLQRNRVHRDSEEVVRMTKEISVERGWDCFKEDGKPCQ